jgi:large subunit ribosomal protein L23
MQLDPHRIIRRPIVTEKGMAVKETQHTVVFEVAAAANKVQINQIKDAVQKIFKVKVAAVRTANFFGKMRRRGMIIGYRRDWKKAYVKLAAGEKMIEYAENL